MTRAKVTAKELISARFAHYVKNETKITFSFQMFSVEKYACVDYFDSLIVPQSGNIQILQYNNV